MRLYSHQHHEQGLERGAGLCSYTSVGCTERCNDFLVDEELHELVAVGRMADEGPQVVGEVGVNSVAADEGSGGRLCLDWRAALPREMPEVVVAHEVPGIKHRS